MKNDKIIFTDRKGNKLEVEVVEATPTNYIVRDDKGELRVFPKKEFVEEPKENWQNITHLVDINKKNLGFGAVHLAQWIELDGILYRATKQNRQAGTPWDGSDEAVLVLERRLPG